MRDKEIIDWEARYDAETLARAEAIKADKERYAKAVKEAKSMAKGKIDEVKGLAKIANKVNELPKVINGRVNKATIKRL